MGNVEFIKSPLNYTGNKSRLLQQLLPIFPSKIERFVDVCCGGGSVGLNVLDRSKEVVGIDANKAVIELLQTLQLFSEDVIVKHIELLIEEYNLSNTHKNGYEIYRKFVKNNNGFKEYNKEGYMKLRSYFNSHSMNYTDRSLYLFALISYCFNNDIRFNSKGDFNMPVGKTDFNNSIREKLHSFKKGIKNRNIKFYYADFSIIKEFELTNKDFVYCDPPYLITNAVYNSKSVQTTEGWSTDQEERLLDVLKYIHSQGVRFALSNVLSKKGKENSILQAWIKENKFNAIAMNYHYRSSSYNKKQRDSNEQEVVITNYDI